MLFNQLNQIGQLINFNIKFEYQSDCADLHNQYLAQYMGSVSMGQSLFKYSGHTWRVSGNGNILRSDIDGTEASFRAVASLSSSDLHCYKFRTLHKYLLVDVLAVLEPQKVEGLPHGSPVVVAEKIEYLLPDLGSLSITDAVYIMRQAIRAITVLRQFFDPFVLDEEMVGFNRQGECKFWVNSDFFQTQVERSFTGHVQVRYRKQSASVFEYSITFCDEKYPKHKLDDARRQAESNQQQATSQIIQNFLLLIESKMQPSAAQSQLSRYYEIKSQFLSVSPPIQCRKSQQPTVRSDQQKKKVPHTKAYQMFITRACRWLAVDDTYRMTVLGEGNTTSKTDKKSAKKTLKRIKSSPIAFNLLLGKQNTAQKAVSIGASTSPSEQGSTNGRPLSNQQTASRFSHPAQSQALGICQKVGFSSPRASRDMSWQA